MTPGRCTGDPQPIRVARQGRPVVNRRRWVTLIALCLAMAAFGFGALARRSAIDRDAPAVAPADR